MWHTKEERVTSASPTGLTSFKGDDGVFGRDDVKVQRSNGAFMSLLLPTVSFRLSLIISSRNGRERKSPHGRKNEADFKSAANWNAFTLTMPIFLAQGEKGSEKERCATRKWLESEMINSRLALKMLPHIHPPCSNLRQFPIPCAQVPHVFEGLLSLHCLRSLRRLCRLIQVVFLWNSKIGKMVGTECNKLLDLHSLRRRSRLYRNSMFWDVICTRRYALWETHFLCALPFVYLALTSSYSQSSRCWWYRVLRNFH